MKTDRSAQYKFHNELNIKFATDNPDFYNFLDQVLSFFRAEGENLPPDLEVKVYFQRNVDLSLRKKIAKDLFADNDQILWQSRLGFKIIAKETNPFQIKAYVWGQPLRDIFNFINSGRRAAREEKYLTVMRSSLYLPLFYLLETRGYIILHGSAVAKDNKAFLFLGANQVGKTTIILNLIYRHNFKLLSDDFLIIKGNRLYAFPDKIRATPFTLNSLPIKTKNHLVYSKHHLDLPREKIIPFSWPAKIFFLQTGPEAKIEKIDLNTGLNRLNAVHNYLGEFPEHSYLAFFPKFPSISDIQNRYTNFLRDKEIFLFQSGGDIDKNLKLLLEDAIL